MAQHLLDVRDLCISFVGRDGNALEAVNKLNLHIDAGEIVGVVGESGCGKSVFAQSVMRLLEHEQKMAYEGQIVFDGDRSAGASAQDDAQGARLRHRHDFPGPFELA